MIEKQLEFDWDIESAVVHISMVRETCQKIYGGTISTEAWANWKKWARVEGRATFIKLYDFRFMVAIARLRAKDKWKELDERVIKAKMTEADHDSIKLLLNSIYRNELARGATVLPLLRREFPQLGLSLSAVQGIIPKFSYNGWYDMHKIRAKVETIADFTVSDDFAGEIPLKPKKKRRSKKK
jgi:hypothetical protein